MKALKQGAYIFCTLQFNKENKIPYLARVQVLFVQLRVKSTSKCFFILCLETLLFSK